jgi:serine/threonine protein kinase
VRKGSQEGYRPIVGSAYVLTQRLDDGTSGFAEIWKAHNALIGHSVVLKFCKYPLASARILTLHNELRILQRLDHAGILRLEAQYLNSPIPFLQYEYCDGVDLARFLDRFSKAGACACTPNQAATVILKLADILAPMHNQPRPIVHGDIKLKNVLVTNHHVLSVFKDLGAQPDLRLADLKIMDFGFGVHSRYGKAETARSPFTEVIFNDSQILQRWVCSVE